MRYTRNRQIMKLGNRHEKSRSWKIEFNRREFGWYYGIDPTFKWNREYNWWGNRIVNWVEFDAQINGWKGTAIIPVKKGYNGGTKTIHK